MSDQEEHEFRRAVEANEAKREAAVADRAEQETNEVDEEDAVREASHMSAKLVYQVVRREGDEELKRPTRSLFWSGIAAGVCISFSVIGEGIFHAWLPESDWLPLIESFGYTFGFLIVIIGRMQLFTENTLTTVLPFLARPSRYLLGCVARLWGIVVAANVIGCFIAAIFIAYIPAFEPEVVEAMKVISRHATENDALTAFFKAIPAGLLIAALVWMLAAGEMMNFFVIFVMTWLIAAGGFTHIIAGSVEMALLLVTGEMGIVHAVFGFWIPVFLGNVFGGTVVFGLITWGQVREEVLARRES
ncbi:formate/nitrite transporter family protein [Loktanella sp. SALINAS62]|uniref:formate/nitrite transporter family protein n=1 Tax=Loktanella sp. SALINAS62 TaxID=2706124 RepID=UPI001B8D62A6|nr:formate/nitrite transporter family protein [Loktanella sp. SALINAS62]MBS1301810.1 formate/nitrite transporter family protein [Loktanella sp. SALINAS62]